MPQHQHSALSDLVRLDLVRQYWRSYAFVCVVSLLVHAAWSFVLGIAPSTDFAVRYDPAARAMLHSLGVENVVLDSSFLPSPYGASRLGYTAFVALCYALWGTSLGAVIYTQIGLVWLVYPLAFHILHHITRRHALSLGAIGVWMTFYDTYQWHFRAVPDSLYRLLFLVSFFTLLRLWETRRDTGFVCTTVVSVAIGAVFRIETPLYALPAFWISAGILRRRHPTLMGIGGVCAVALAWVGRDFLREMLKVFVYLQAKGFILPGSGMDALGVTYIDPPLTQSWVSLALYAAHLFSARFWYAITPLPPLWSRAHRMYYAIYIVPAYALSVCGLIAAVRRKDTVFVFCAWMFAAGILLQVLVAVDPSMRYAYTPHVFLFFCAAMGWPEAWTMIAGRRDRDAHAAGAPA